MILRTSLLLLFLGSLTHAADPLKGEIEKALRQGSLEIWYPRIIDAENGGFLCDFDHQWKAAGKQDKTIVFQARFVWLAARAMQRYPDDPRYKMAADHGLKFLREVMWDKEHGGFYWHLNRKGEITPDWAGAKHAYGIAFGIYGAAAHHRATKSPESLKLAQDAFRWLDAKGHDAKHGGYNEYFARDGTLIMEPSQNPRAGNKAAGCIGPRVGLKSMNAHIHILEALTGLHHAWPDPAVKQRLEEVFLILRDKVTVPPGVMHQYFLPDWRPIPDLASYGHDIETAYLLIEAAEALGLKDDARTHAIAKSMVDNALDVAWDKSNGGVWEAGLTFGPIHDKRKVWWTQAETLNSLLLMARRYPEDPRSYRKLFERQWAYIQKNLIDAKNGEWHENGLDGEGSSPTKAKSTQWKCGYHNGRAMMNVIDGL